VIPIKAPLSLEEAIARALKYNLERRSRMMEEAIALNQLDVSHYDMLPKLVASAGYSSRSEYATTRAVDSVTGQPSLANPFISSDKHHATAAAMAVIAIRFIAVLSKRQKGTYHNSQ